MNLQEFIDKYNNQYVEVGGSANAMYQCVDLANRLIIDVYGDEPLFGTNAKDFWTKMPSEYARITPDSPPKAGDIVIWSIGTVGHIAIATGNNSNGKFQSFDQNYPVGSKSHLVNHDYKNLIGYLRKDEMTKEDIVKLIYKATQGKDPSPQELSAVIGLPEDQIANMRFKDDVIGGYWKVSTGTSCPQSEKDHWDTSIKNGSTIGDLQDTWFQDHIRLTQVALINANATIQDLRKQLANCSKPDSEIEKLVKEIIKLAKE